METTLPLQSQAPKLAPLGAKPNAVAPVVDGLGDMSQLPEDLRFALKVFDFNGDGKISPVELARAATLYQSWKSRYKKIFYFGLLSFLIILILLGGLSCVFYFVLQATKETKLDVGSGLQTVKGKSTLTTPPVSASTASVASDIKDLLGMSPMQLSQVKQIMFTLSTAPDTHFSYTITGFRSAPSTLTLLSASSDRIILTKTNITVENVNGETLFTDGAGPQRRFLSAFTSALGSVAGSVISVVETVVSQEYNKLTDLYDKGEYKMLASDLYDKYELAKDFILSNPLLDYGSSTVPLNDPELLKLLVEAAGAAYYVHRDPPFLTPNKTIADGALQLIDFQADSYLADKYTQYGVFLIKEGKHTGKKILGIRGTTIPEFSVQSLLDFSPQTLLQDFSIIAGGPSIRRAAIEATKAAQKHKVSFVTGHSLGGLLAEAVSSKAGISGASFNAPGPYGVLFDITGAQYNEVPFEVHLRHEDFVSWIGSPVYGAKYSHIGTPEKGSMIWHGEEGASILESFADHGISNMCRYIGCFSCTDINDEACFRQ